MNKGTPYDKYCKGWREDGDPLYSRQQRETFAIQDSLSEGGFTGPAKEKSKSNKTKRCFPHNYRWEVKLVRWWARKIYDAVYEIKVCEGCGKIVRRRYDEDYYKVYQEYLVDQKHSWDKWLASSRKSYVPPAPYGVDENGTPIRRGQWKQAPKKRLKRKGPRT